MSCDYCGCSCAEDEATPEELAAVHARANERLALRMTPARSAVEQIDRDIEAAMDSAANQMAAALYGRLL